MTLAASRETTSTTVEIVVNTNNGDTIPVPLLSLDKLTEGATVIVMGQPSSVQHVGSTSIDTSCLKGDLELSSILLE